MRLLVASLALLAALTLAGCGDDSKAPGQQDKAVSTADKAVSTADKAVNTTDIAKPDSAQVDKAVVTGDTRPVGDGYRTCTNEVAFTSQSLPCWCYGTLIYNVALQFPTCTSTMKCCPGEKKPKCE